MVGETDSSVEHQKGIILMPCSGLPDLGVSSGHVYGIMILGRIKFFCEAGEAIKSFPKAYVSRSATICPECTAKLKQLTKKKR